MRRAWVLAVVFVGLLGVTPVEAASDDALLKLLIRKGILTQEEVDALKREIEAESAPAPTPGPPPAVTPPATTAAPGGQAAPAGQAPVTEAQLNEAVGQVRNEILTELAEKEEAAISLWGDRGGGGALAAVRQRRRQE
jgi:hypothetical protein